MCMLGENGKLKCPIDLVYVYVHRVHFLYNFNNKIRMCLLLSFLFFLNEKDVIFSFV